MVPSSMSLSDLKHLQGQDNIRSQITRLIVSARGGHCAAAGQHKLHGGQFSRGIVFHSLTGRSISDTLGRDSCAAKSGAASRYATEARGRFD